jgi:hypothetical protein
MQSLLAMATTLDGPGGIGLMMWIMMRGHGRARQTTNPGSQQIEELRARSGGLKPNAPSRLDRGRGL